LAGIPLIIEDSEMAHCTLGDDVRFCHT
jgi:hypothetical protein